MTLMSLDHLPDRRRKTFPPAPQLRKTCTTCGETKMWEDFYARSRWEDGTMRSPASRCKVCERELVRERCRREQAENPEKVRERNRAKRAKIKADPVLYDEYRERRRTYKARTLGRPIRPKLAPEEDVKLPAEPFVQWADAYMEKTGASKQQVAEIFGFDESSFRRWKSGEYRTIRLSIADAGFCRLGLPHMLNELWPFDQGEEVAA